MSPTTRERRKSRTIRAAQSSKSASAVTWTALPTGTSVAFGNSAAARAASDIGVITSRSPLRTSTGTVGYAAPGGRRIGDGGRRPAQAAVDDLVLVERVQPHGLRERRERVGGQLRPGRGELRAAGREAEATFQIVG